MNGIPVEGKVREMAVFRALDLAGMLCAVPALRSWREAFPAARITLVGLPWAKELAHRLRCVDDFIAFPGCPGVPEAGCNRAALRDFLVDVMRRRFDLAVQLHGRGRIVNALVASFGARQNAGFRDVGAWYPRHDGMRFVAWPHDEASEVERLLTLSDGLGLPRQGQALEFPIEDGDRQALAQAAPALADSRPYVCLHIGAHPLSERPQGRAAPSPPPVGVKSPWGRPATTWERWQAGRFAAVADEIAAEGRTVALSGSPEVRELAAEVIARMHAPAIDLVGKTSMWTLGALVEGAECVVACDDPAVALIADALKCRCVAVSTSPLVDAESVEGAGLEDPEEASTEMINLDDWLLPQGCGPNCEPAGARV